MIKDLFIFDLKENKVLIVVFTLIILIYGTVSVGMYDPNTAEAFDAILDMLPAAVIRMMGFDNMGGAITPFISNYLYGFIMLIFPLIFTIMVGNRLVSRHVDSGSMIYLITTPYTRRKIVITQAVFFVTSMFFIFLVNVGVIIIMAEAMFPGMLEIGNFLVLNLVTFAVHMLLAGVTFVFSVVFGDSSKCIGFSGGLLISFFVLTMLSGIDEKTEFLKYFTPFSFIDIEYILSGHGLLFFFGLSVVATGVFIGGIELFHKKSLII